MTYYQEQECGVFGLREKQGLKADGPQQVLHTGIYLTLISLDFCVGGCDPRKTQVWKVVKGAQV